jgi:exodeoxyribonuclease-3
VEAKLQPVNVRWPVSSALVQFGLLDTFRIVYPDPVAKPGLTWTSKNMNQREKHDRIDFIYASKSLKISSLRVFGETQEMCDVVVEPYPTDHRCLCCEFEL